MNSMLIVHVGRDVKQCFLGFGMHEEITSRNTQMNDNNTIQNSHVCRACRSITLICRCINFFKAVFKVQPFFRHRHSLFIEIVYVYK